jgi:Icc-related predicted phosphoesterase
MKKFYNGSKELQNLNNEFKNKLVYLQDSLYTYKDGTTIYGCPWCTQFGHWAFMGDHELITAKYKMIPDNVDIILCHQPPFGYGDVGTILEGNKGDVGSTELASRLNDIQFKWLFCGHIHSGNHTPYDTGHGKVVNVSYVNEHYYPWYKAFTI